jgi:hypothetical protein
MPKTRSLIMTFAYNAIGFLFGKLLFSIIFHQILCLYSFQEANRIESTSSFPVVARFFVIITNLSYLFSLTLWYCPHLI